MIHARLVLVRNVAAGVVAAIAAWSSYSHMVEVALRFGEGSQVAYALPLSVDGMLVVASVAMADDRQRQGRVRPIVRVAFAAGVIASVAANIAAAQPSYGARIVAAWPAVALLLVVEILARRNDEPSRRGRPTAPEESRPAVTVPTGHRVNLRPSRLPAEPEAAAVPEQAVAAEPVAVAVAEPAEAGEAAVRRPAVVAVEQARTLEVASARPRRAGTRQSPGDDAARAGRRNTGSRRKRPTAETRRLAEQILDENPSLSRVEVAARLGVSTRRLREVFADR